MGRRNCDIKRVSFFTNLFFLVAGERGREGGWSRVLSLILVLFPTDRRKKMEPFFLFLLLVFTLNSDISSSASSLILLYSCPPGFYLPLFSLIAKTKNARVSSYFDSVFLNYSLRRVLSKTFFRRNTNFLL